MYKVAAHFQKLSRLRRTCITIIRHPLSRSLFIFACCFTYHIKKLLICLPMTDWQKGGTSTAMDLPASFSQWLQKSGYLILRCNRRRCCLTLGVQSDIGNFRGKVYISSA